MTEFVNHRGEPIAFGNSPSYVAKQRPKREGPGAYHRGFSVEGHRPGAVEEAQRVAEAEAAKWADLPEDEKSRRLTSGERQPKPWNKERWLETAKPSKVRAKPYELECAADQCKAMAEKAGWLCVRVVEIKKGDANAQA